MRSTFQALTRFEFMHTIVRIAINTYVRMGQEISLPKALALLFQKLQKHLPPEARHDPDAFRRQRFYKQGVHELLSKYEAQLRVVFDYYATTEQVGRRPLPRATAHQAP